MPDTTGDKDKGSPKTPNDEGTCKRRCGDCSECPKCKSTIARDVSSASAVKDFKVTESRQSSRGINDAEKKEEKKETEECKRNLTAEEKEDPLVKWFPDHISKDPLKHPLVPYPHPPLMVELRGGNFIHFCHCLRRNGLQSECPHTECQGKRECMQAFLPDCIPSGLRLPGKPPAYLQKADDPECYSKTELVKAYEKVMNETVTGGTGGIEGDREKMKLKQVESRGTVVTKPPSATSLISEHGDEGEGEKKKVRIRPNSPPNYISTPAVDAYPAPCRRHATVGIPGSMKYEKYARCRLRKGKTLPTVIGPKRSRESIE